MEKQQFEHLIKESGLHLDGTFSHLLRFMVSLHVKKQFGTQYMNDTLAFGRDEFAAMTKEEAQFHIDACKSRLESAARMKTPAWLYYPEYCKPKHLRLDNPQRQTQQKIPAIATTMAVNYPAH